MALRLPRAAAANLTFGLRDQAGDRGGGPSCITADPDHLRPWGARRRSPWAGVRNTCA